MLLVALLVRRSPRGQVPFPGAQGGRASCMGGFPVGLLAGGVRRGPYTAAPSLLRL